jgi:hypothetical protein
MLEVVPSILCMQNNLEVRLQALEDSTVVVRVQGIDVCRRTFIAIVDHRNAADQQRFALNLPEVLECALQLLAGRRVHSPRSCREIKNRQLGFG